MTTLRAALQDRTDALRVCQSTGAEVQAALAGQTRRRVAAEAVGSGLRDALDQARAEAARLASELAVAGLERAVLAGALADARRHAALARDDREAARQRLAQTGHALAERGGTLARMVQNLAAEQAARDADQVHWLRRIEEAQTGYRELKAREASAQEQIRTLWAEINRCRGALAAASGDDGR